MTKFRLYLYARKLKEFRAVRRDDKGVKEIKFCAIAQNTYHHGSTNSLHTIKMKY